MFSIEIQTDRLISLRFGTGILLNVEMILRLFSAPRPRPKGPVGPEQGLGVLCSLIGETW
jgi:hypothetical protein